MAKTVTPEMLLEQHIGSIVRRELRVHGLEPSSPVYDVAVGVAVAVVAAINHCRNELGSTPPPPSTKFTRAAGHNPDEAVNWRGRDGG